MLCQRHHLSNLLCCSWEPEHNGNIVQPTHCTQFFCCHSSGESAAALWHKRHVPVTFTNSCVSYDGVASGCSNKDYATTEYTEDAEPAVLSQEKIEYFIQWWPLRYRRTTRPVWDKEERSRWCREYKRARRSVAWIFVLSWLNKQINVPSGCVAAVAAGWQQALMKPREEDLLYHRGQTAEHSSACRKEVRKINSAVPCRKLHF